VALRPFASGRLERGGRVMYALRTGLERLSDDTTDVKMLLFKHFSETDECQSSSTYLYPGKRTCFLLEKIDFINIELVRGRSWFSYFSSFQC
jgi:hypothetical protein